MQRIDWDRIGQRGPFYNNISTCYADIWIRSNHFKLIKNRLEASSSQSLSGWSTNLPRDTRHTDLETFGEKVLRIFQTNGLFVWT